VPVNAPLPVVVVDAFTDRPFAGNPAAVCVLPGPADPEWMQLVAREMSLSETAFVHRDAAAGPDDWRLRWFTPTVEETLCGHATLASAHVIWEEARAAAPDRPLRFHSKSGLLVASRAEGGGIEMDFPATPVEAAAPPAGLLEGLAVPEPRFAGRSRFDWLVEVASEADVRALCPDMRRLAAVGGRGVIVTAAPGPPGHDFVSRFFAPNDGVDEDPVTGSAHCALACHWAPRLGRTSFVAFQASARGGVVRVRLEGDRAILGGAAVTVLRGVLA